MKRPPLTLVLAAIGVLLVVVSYWKLVHRPSFEPQMTNEPPADSVAVLSGGQQQPTPTPESSGQPVALSTAPPENEAASLDSMTKALIEFTRPERAMDELLRFLQDSKQEPFVSVSKSVETGDLSIVRTKSPFPGTRYFHAQYFSGAGENYVQHMSFEFRPGAQAFQDAMAAVQKNYSGLGKPEIQNKDFVQWDLGNGGVIWIKRMGAADLKDDPFNAYTKDDLGTVRVAFELKPEADDEDHH